MKPSKRVGSTLSDYFVHCKRVKTGNVVAKSDENDIFTTALQEQVDNILQENSCENKKKVECDGTMCRFVKELQEVIAAKSCLEQKYTALKSKYTKAMDLNLKLQEKMEKTTNSISSTHQINQSEIY